MIRTARATLFIAAPPELVFDVFTHHETYRELSIVRGTTLIAPGSPEAANGTGAIRELDLGMARMRELVTDMQRPSYWDYRFIAWPLPHSHQGGRMSFEAEAGGTRLTWVSTVEADGPLGLTVPLLAWSSSAGLWLLAWQMRRIVMRRLRER